MPPPKTPKGIVLLAVVYFLMAGSFALIAGLFAVAPASLGALGFRLDPDASTRLPGFSFFAATAAIAGAVGYGLWRLKGWARSVVIFSAVSTLLGSVINFSMSAFGVPAPFAHSRLTACVVSLAVLGYLWTPGVRTVFGAQERALR